MATETVLEVIAVIAERTAENDHNQALICASTLLDNARGCGETNRTKILKHVREIHYLRGHMTSALIELREERRNAIMVGLRDLLTKEEYKALTDAL